MPSKNKFLRGLDYNPSHTISRRAERVAVEEAKDSEIYESVRQLTQRSKPAPKDGASSSGGGGSSSFVGGLKRGFKHVRTTLKSFFHSKCYSKLSTSDSEETSSARSSYKSVPKGFRLDHLSISLESLRRSFPPLLQRGSAKYTHEQKKLVVRGVFSHLIQLMEDDGIDASRISEPESDAEEDDDVMEVEEEEEELTLSGIDHPLSDSVSYISKLLRIDRKLVRAWTYEWHQNGFFQETLRDDSRPTLIDTSSKCTLEALIETMEFYMHERENERRVNYLKIQTHLSSSVRYFEAFKSDLSLCPPVHVSRKVLMEQCNNVGIFIFTKIHRTGKVTRSDEEVLERMDKRRWAIRYWIALYDYWLKMEKDGKALLCFMVTLFFALLSSFALTSIYHIALIHPGRVVVQS